MIYRTAPFSMALNGFKVTPFLTLNISETVQHTEIVSVVKVQFLDDWTLTLDLGIQIDVIYTDFEKAFDKVPHQRLISKLQSYTV